jgi:hypothetical protein
MPAKRLVKRLEAETTNSTTVGEERNSDMARVTLGEHSKIIAAPAVRERLQGFFRDVLGCTVLTKSATADLIQLGPDFSIWVHYDESALCDSDAQKAIWLELRTDDPEELREEILKFGIPGIEFRDKEHFYFQAPGGQVFRLAGANGDMSKRGR